MTTTMSPEASAHAEWALLNELAEQLAIAERGVVEMRDSRTARWPDADLQMCLGWVVATIEALDAISEDR